MTIIDDAMCSVPIWLQKCNVLRVHSNSIAWLVHDLCIDQISLIHCALLASNAHLFANKWFWVQLYMTSICEIIFNFVKVLCYLLLKQIMTNYFASCTSTGFIKGDYSTGAAHFATDWRVLGTTPKKAIRSPWLF